MNLKTFKIENKSRSELKIKKEPEKLTVTRFSEEYLYDNIHIEYITDTFIFEDEIILKNVLLSNQGMSTEIYYGRLDFHGDVNYQFSIRIDFKNKKIIIWREKTLSEN